MQSLRDLLVCATSARMSRRIRKVLSSQEIVELLLAIGYYMMIARLCETTDVDVEPPSEQVAKQARDWRPR